MKVARLLGRLMLADFLERVRRHSFLVTLGFTVFAAYMFLPPNHSRYATLNLHGHRGVYNSAWVGSLVAMLTVLFLSLAGFFLVKNAIERDRRTGVGQILAATPLPTPIYLLGKWASNLAVLAAMVGVLVVTAAVMQVVRAEEPRLDVPALLSPFMWVTLPSMALVSALAVCFEVVPGLRGSLGNLVYFILWNVSLSTTILMPGAGIDFVGSQVLFTQMQAACARVYPDYALGGPLTMGFNIKAQGVWDLKTFVWDGAAWSPAAMAGRAMWVAVAVALTLLGSLVFDRFDTHGQPRERRGTRDQAGDLPARVTAPRVAAVAARAPSLPAAASGARSRLGGLVVAELRILLQGISRWWWIVVLGLTVASLLAPLAGVRQFVIPFALVWPVLRWSPMGTRERQHRTDALLFSAPRPVARLLVAQWMAGAALAAAVAAGGLVRFALAGEWASVAALLVAVVFVPSLALAFGVWSGSGKLFEVLYLILWYMGPMNRIPLFDFLGTTQPESGSAPAIRFLILSAALAALALQGRRRQLAH